jgi:NitT/TauT family transport system ATP-binding protein
VKVGQHAAETLPSRVDSTPKLELIHVSKTFTTARGGTHNALDDVNLAVADGEFVCVIGPSGSGKTTLLSIMAGLTPATSGEIRVEGRPVHGPGRDRGVVFQQDSIFPWRTVRRNVEYGLEMSKVPKKERRQIAERYLELVHLTKFADFYPKELSGGMKKRAVIATVFANNPGVLLMDEPFGSLDYGTKAQLQEEVLDIWAREKKTTVFITHDVEEAAFLADRIVVLQRGRKTKEISVELPRPRDEEVRLSVDLAELRHEVSALLHQNDDLEG